MNYKDEFNYHSVRLLFGESSPYIADLKIFGIDTMRKHQEILFSEWSALSTENTPDTVRTLRISSTRYFYANHSKMSSGVCGVVNFVDTLKNVHASDMLFTDREYAYFKEEWDTAVKNKVRTLGMLIRSICYGTLTEVPLLINEFPNITNILFNYPEMWVKE